MRMPVASPRIMLLGGPRCGLTRSYVTLASPLALPGQSYHRPSGMAITPWQLAPDMVAAPLRGRPHGTVPGQFAVDPWASHGGGMASAAIKISHKASLSPPRKRYVFMAGSRPHTMSTRHRELILGGNKFIFFTEGACKFSRGLVIHNA